ncbi:aspartate/glutamate racemase family protein [Pantoea stewartii]|uniref:aspartate/glutamate racemase family protein n=1 Tax=Pantoea stewartii TaxID=66269 RepID=UPI002DB9C39C|nr:aspartate/glutamate racemase family protein [Pantoea stewartii]MEB6537111.1 aspartate/glutamate racemase family protein [Pantoea stewartii]
MQTIGILGGMSAASTQIYYRQLCDLVRQRSGGLHSPELLIRSLDFARIEHLQASGKWDDAATILNVEAKALARAGADFIILATNTMHKLADQMMSDVKIPLLHIADATAARIIEAGHKKPGLIATKFTMEQPFYLDCLKAATLLPLVPDEGDRADVHRIIYNELCRDIVNPDSRVMYEYVARRLVDSGADCVILGCTEVGMLLNKGNVSVPVFDTTLIHCEAAIDKALNT